MYTIQIKEDDVVKQKIRVDEDGETIVWLCDIIEDGLRQRGKTNLEVDYN